MKEEELAAELAGALADELTEMSTDSLTEKSDQRLAGSLVAEMS